MSVTALSVDNTDVNELLRSLGETFGYLSSSEATPMPETKLPTVVKKDDVATSEQDLEAFQDITVPTLFLNKENDPIADIKMAETKSPTIVKKDNPQQSLAAPSVDDTDVDELFRNLDETYGSLSSSLSRTHGSVEDTPTAETKSPRVKKDDVATSEQDLKAFQDITVPTLFLNKEDDPIAVAKSIPFGKMATSERDLGVFLARANLAQLYEPLCRGSMWLPGLRAIPLGQLHNDLLPIVPKRPERQRLIDALHSGIAVDVRLSHKEKQGMWHLARDEGRTAFIRGMASLTDLELRQYLGVLHGHVIDMRYMFDARNNSFLGYGFVMFERKEAVDSILRNTSYTVREGVTLMVKSSDDIEQ